MTLNFSQNNKLLASDFVLLEVTISRKKENFPTG